MMFPRVCALTIPLFPFYHCHCEASTYVFQHWVRPPIHTPRSLMDVPVFGSRQRTPSFCYSLLLESIEPSTTWYWDLDERSVSFFSDSMELQETHWKWIRANHSLCKWVSAVRHMHSTLHVWKDPKSIKSEVWPDMELAVRRANRNCNFLSRSPLLKR